MRERFVGMFDSKSPDNVIRDRLLGNEDWISFPHPEPRQVNSYSFHWRGTVSTDRNRVGNGLHVISYNLVEYLGSSSLTRTSSQLELQPALTGCEMRHGLVRRLNFCHIRANGLLKVMKRERRIDIIGH